MGSEQTAVLLTSSVDTVSPLTLLLTPTFSRGSRVGSMSPSAVPLFPELRDGRVPRAKSCRLVGGVLRSISGGLSDRIAARAKRSQADRDQIRYGREFASAVLANQRRIRLPVDPVSALGRVAAGKASGHPRRSVLSVPCGGTVAAYWTQEPLRQFWSLRSTGIRWRKLVKRRRRWWSISLGCSTESRMTVSVKTRSETLQRSATRSMETKFPEKADT
jgi:hypothetical protein